MKIVRIKGGLGNQMFQYAFAKLVEHLTDTIVKLDMSDYESLLNDPIRSPRLLCFNLSLPIAEKTELKKYWLTPHKGNTFSSIFKLQLLIEKWFNRKYYLETNRAFVDPARILKYDFFDGYWQSHKYLSAINGEIKKDFVSKEKISEKSAAYIDAYKNDNVTFVGIRKGDYLAEINHYGVLSNDYYLRGMEYIESHCPGSTFCVFTNDVEWCKQNLDFKDFRVDYREKYMQVNDFEELLIMSSCKNAIISNSSFNWWGAYLIDNPNKIVICPKEWFTDYEPINIIPEEWVRIER